MTIRDSNGRDFSDRNIRETAALSGTSSESTARAQDIDEGFADVLARAAALSDLTRDEFETTDAFIDAHIRLVVDRSALRLRFPEPDRHGRECDISERDSVRGPRMEVLIGNGKPRSLRLGGLLCRTVETTESVMLLAKTSEEAYTALFRTCGGVSDPWVELLQARDEAESLVRSLAEDVGRRRGESGPWQLSLALVALSAMYPQAEAMPESCQWWTGSIAEREFGQLLRRAAEPHTDTAALAVPLHPDAGVNIKLVNLRRIANQELNETWHWHGLRSTRTGPRPAEAPRAGWFRSLVQRALEARDLLVERVYEVMHLADQTALRLRLPQPPPPEAAPQLLPRRQPAVRVLVDRELATAG